NTAKSDGENCRNSEQHGNAAHLFKEPTCSMSLFHSQRTHSPQRARRSLVYQSRYMCATKGPLFFCVVCDIFLATMYNEWKDYKKKLSLIRLLQEKESAGKRNTIRPSDGKKDTEKERSVEVVAEAPSIVIRRCNSAAIAPSHALPETPSPTLLRTLFSIQRP
ncbi:MAG: hypothetical protein CL920_19530, partial [Deltaproteobacteria bacterium]|nr:hypothetical protein [Deltaproteobacteria bacterium]